VSITVAPPGPAEPVHSPTVIVGRRKHKRRNPAVRKFFFKNGLRVFVIGYLAMLVAVPVATIAYRAFEPGFSTAWRDLTDPGGAGTGDFVHALILTLVVAAIAVPLNTVFGVGTALLLARHRFPGARLLDAAIDLPIAISPVVVGLSLLLVYDRSGWIGSWLAGRGIQIAFSIPGIVLASAFISIPYVAREVLPVLQEIGTEQEQAAATLGAGPIVTLLRITLPSIRWGIAYGVVLTTARVLGEFGAVSIISGNIQGQTETLTLYVSNQFADYNLVGAYMGGLVLAVISLLVLGLLSLSKRKESRSWRSKSAESQSASARQ
jgi:sulfate/thiosulfate transport system permease protein